MSFCRCYKNTCFCGRNYWCTVSGHHAFNIAFHILSLGGFVFLFVAYLLDLGSNPKWGMAIFYASFMFGVAQLLRILGNCLTRNPDLQNEVRNERVREAEVMRTTACCFRGENPYNGSFTGDPIVIPVGHEDRGRRGDNYPDNADMALEWAKEGIYNIYDNKTTDCCGCFYKTTSNVIDDPESPTSSSLTTMKKSLEATRV